MRFTDRYLASLRPKDKRYVVREDQGFAIRVFPSGHKTFLFIYDFDGHRREMDLGSYPLKSLAEAHADHLQAYAMLRDPIRPRDPLGERKKEREAEKARREEIHRQPTVGALVEEYLSYAQEKKKCWGEDKRILEKDVLPHWKNRLAQEISRRDVLHLLEGMKRRGPAITLNTFKIIRRMFKFAVKREIVSSSPCVGFEKYDELPVVPSRERTLDEREIRVFWESVDKAGISPEVVRALKLILVTCQRPGEVITMHRSQIKDRWWEFTPKRTRVTIQHPRPQRIYLTDLALELIGDGEGYIFPSPTADGPITERAVGYAVRRNIKGYKRKKPAMDPSAGDVPKMVPVPEERKMELAHFTPHDLRRTGATMIASLGFSDEIIDAVLSHLKTGIIKVYNRHSYDLEKQAAMEAWERKLLALVTGRAEVKVLPFRRYLPPPSDEA